MMTYRILHYLCNMKKRFEHEWGFMTNPGTIGRSDLAYCPLCKQWIMDGYKGGKPFKMPYTWYIQMYIDGKIRAREVLGSIEDAKEKLKTYE
jgi:hypothetical protein